MNLTGLSASARIIAPVISAMSCSTLCLALYASQLAPETRMLFVMGEKDEQSLGKPVDKGLLTGTIAKMPNKAAVEVLWVPRGGHNALDVPKTKRQESNDRILETVAAFIGK